MSLAGRRLQRVKRGDDAPPTEVRNMYQQPFSQTSIWNRPIGSGAVLASLTSLAAAKGGNWAPPRQGHSVDESFIVLDPNLTTTARLMERSYWWPYPDNSKPPTYSGTSVKVPTDYLIPNPGGSTPNNMCGMLKAGAPNYIATECQYVVRPTAGSDIVFHHYLRGDWDLRGEGINDGFGSHGGAGMCCLGGTIRGGELVGPNPIQHALSVTINTQKWAIGNGGGIANGYRWPAQAADSNWASSNGGYGSQTNSQGAPLSNAGVALDGMGMGTLLALPSPSSLNLDTLGFETVAGRKIAGAMQGYGAYVVDTSHDPGAWDVWMWNTDKAANADCPQIGESYDGGNPGMNGAYARDLNKILARLCIVTNNAAGGICSGGGTPIAPIVPPLG